MATVRAQRLLNNVVNGTTNATALQTALGTASTRADFQQVVGERGKARVIAATTNSANAVGGSALATEDYISSVAGPQEMFRNRAKFNASSIGATVAASDSLMNAWTSNTNSLALSQQAILGRDIYASSFAPNYSRRIVAATANGAASWDVWAPALTQVPTFSGNNQTDFAMNNDGSILLYLGTGLGDNANCLRRSTNKGATFSLPTTIGTSGQLMRAMDFGAGLFVIVGDAGRIYSSTDGITWTQRTSGHTNSLQRVRFENGVFITAGPSNIMTSTDGITWTNRSTGAGSQCRSIGYVGNNTWIAGFDSSTAYRSTDNGTNWSSFTLTSGYSSLFSVAGNGTGYVLGGFSANGIAYSLNYGSTWANIGVLTGVSGNVSVVFYAGLFWIRSSSSANTIVSISPTPISATLGVDFVSTDGVYVTRNGYNMLSAAVTHDYELQTVKQNRLFIRGTTAFMTYLGQ